MVYPTISEYIEAIRYAEDNFATLTHLRPVLDDDGNPVMSSGNFAVVFKMQDGSGKFYALKCFTRDQEGRAEAYKIICDELAKIASPYFVNTEYYDRELFVNSQQSTETEFPVLLMDWVEGQNLTEYIEQHKDDSFELYEVCFKFTQFAMWLLDQPFAHGDLKPDNIIIVQQTVIEASYYGDLNYFSIVVVDYDGMYFPKMYGQNARELGSPDYRHPNRHIGEFGTQIDDFAISSIILSLNALSLDNKRFENLRSNDNILLSAADYNNISKSKIFNSLIQMSQTCPELERYLACFFIALSKAKLTKQLLDVSDLYNCFNEENCVLSRKHVLWLGLNIQERIMLPKTIRAIGDRAFSLAVSIKTIIIPEPVEEIGECAFISCNNLTTIILPNSVKTIKEGAFYDCSNLVIEYLPNQISAINRFTFAYCSSLEKINIPSSVEEIRMNAFDGCKRLEKISLPNSVKSIDDGAFSDCYNLETIDIPDSVTWIGSWAFERCRKLFRFTIPNSITCMGWGVFNGCSNLSYISISDSLTEISGETFAGCRMLSEITIPSSVKGISDRAFENCVNLKEISLPDSITSIGLDIFDGCDDLETIIIPKGFREKFEQLLPDYIDLLEEFPFEREEFPFEE